MNHPAILLIVAAIFATAHALNDTSELRCVFCESDNSNDCIDLGEDIKEVLCKDLNYDDVSRSGGNMQNKDLLPVFKRESTRAVAEGTQFACIKITLKKENDENFIRTCAPIQRGIDKVCEYIEQEIEPRMKVKDCYECRNDACNSAMGVMRISFVTGVLMTLVALFITRR